MTNKQILLFWIFVGAVALIIVVPLYFRVSGDLEVCRLYYPEMSRMQCYFSSKTVRVPGGPK